MDYPEVKLFIYMDSDAVIDKNFEFTPLNDMMKIMQTNLEWDPILKPMVFNQVCIGSKFLIIRLCLCRPCKKSIVSISSNFLHHSH